MALRYVFAVVSAGLSVTALTHCASPSATGDETHFWCSADADCSRFKRQICELNRCTPAPDGYPSDDNGGVALNLPADPSPGPAADCTAAPPDEATFETTARRLPPATIQGEPLAFGLGPVMNANGSVIAFAAATHEDAPGALKQGHLVRWVGDAVSKLGSLGTQMLEPTGVSCDGFTIVGSRRGPDNAVRWTAAAGFRVLELDSGPTESSYGMAASDTDDSAYGYGAGTGYRWAADGTRDSLFAYNGQVRAWGRGGRAVVLGSVLGEDLLAGVSTGGAADFARIPLVGPDGCDAPVVTLVSPTASFVAGVSTCAQRSAVFVFSDEGGMEFLPDGTSPRAVTPAGVVVGTRLGPEPERGIVWSRSRGVRLLRDILADHGVTVPETTTIHAVTDVSDDARVFTGTSTDGRDAERVNIFRAVLPAGAVE
jgi:hypothetical protein